MHFTHREIWTSIHGIILGAGFLLLFTGSFVGVWMLKSARLTANGARACARFSAMLAWLMALLAFAAAFIGTYLIYPWYRAAPPAGVSGAALSAYPKYLLMSSASTRELHEFGMEWKEHVAWLAPMLAAAVAYSLSRLGAKIAEHPKIRAALLVLLSTAFFCAAVAGLFGALINKAAPTR